MLRRLLLPVLCVTPLFAASYRFGTIWDGSKTWKDSCITVDKDRIQSVGACDAAAIDLSRFRHPRPH